MTDSAPIPSSASVAWLRKAFFLSVVAFMWWRVSDNTADNDLWGHVLYGQRMLHLGRLETVETLSWTATGLPWINHEVLAELALGLTHRLGGGAGLWLLMVTMAVLTLGWAWREGAGPERNRHLIAIGLLALSANFIALGYAARPQLFTYLFFVALLASLRRYFAGARAWAALPPLVLLVWVNTHGGFLAGWTILLLALGTEFVAPLVPQAMRWLRAGPVAPSRLSLTGLAAGGSLALLANPWGWKLVVWTAATLRLPRPNIYEWHAMPFTVATLPFYAVVLLGAAAWLLSRQARRPWELVTWALLAMMSIQTQRHAPLFGLASLIFLPIHLADLFARLAPHVAGLRATVQRPGLAAAGTLALLAAGGFCLHASMSAPRAHPFRMEVPRQLFPVAAIEFIRTHQLNGNTITFFDWGQQVLWELPDNPVSFDGRLDTVYPVGVMEAHWRLYAGEDPGASLDLTRAQVALLPTAGGGVRWLRTQGWRIVYADSLATVLLRQSAPAAPVWGEAAAVVGSVSFPDALPMLATPAARTADAR